MFLNGQRRWLDFRLGLLGLLLCVAPTLQHVLPNEKRGPTPTVTPASLATLAPTPPPLLIPRATTPSLSDLSNPSYIMSILASATDIPNLSNLLSILGTSTSDLYNFPYPSIAFPTITIAYPNPNPTSNNSNNNSSTNGALIGGIVGGICAFILGIAAAAWFVHSRKKSSGQKGNMNEPKPQQIPPPGPANVVPYQEPGVYAYGAVPSSEAVWNPAKFAPYDPYAGQTGAGYLQPPASVNPPSTYAPSITSQEPYTSPTSYSQPAGRVIMSANSVTIVPHSSHAGSSTADDTASTIAYPPDSKRPPPDLPSVHSPSSSSAPSAWAPPQQNPIPRPPSTDFSPPPYEG